MDSQASAPTKKMKKTGRYVASRYQQAALQKSMMKANASSIMTTKCSDTVFLDQSIANWKENKCTSTPAPGKYLIPECDESALTSELFIPVKETADIKKPVPRCTVKTGIEKNSVPFLVLPKKKDDSMNSEQAKELELDLCYGIYLQAVYLESRSKKTLELRADDAMKNVHKMWSINQTLTKQKKALSHELNCLNYMKQLKEFCQTQKEFYKQTNSHVPTTMSQYEEISKAVETIRNKLQLSDVDFPQDSSDKDELVKVVKDCENILSSIFESLPTLTSELPQMASLLQKVTTLRADIKTEIESNHKLLCTVDQLTVDESFLRLL